MIYISKYNIIYKENIVKTLMSKPAIIGIKKIHATYEENLPGTENALSYLSIGYRPHVIMPNGQILTRSGDTRAQDFEFDDTVAKLYARENDGIYMPSGFGSPDVRVPFKDIIKIWERCVANISRPNNTSDEIRKQALAPDFLKEWEKEGAFLENVYGISGGQFHTVQALEGPITRNPDILLRLPLSGFGYKHFKVADRTLIATLNAYPAFTGNSDPARAINDFVHNSNDKENPQLFHFNYSFFNRDGEESSSGPVNKIIIQMSSPNPSPSQDREAAKGTLPRLETEAMLTTFQEVVSRIDKGLSALSADRRTQEEIRLARTKRIMNL
jgi:hypothetical protein